eukprot:12199865-Ditylum_brightwellii.AAC.1
MHKKGLNPNSTSDIASAKPCVYLMYLESIEGCTDELSRKIREMMQNLSIFYHYQLNFQVNNQVWNPNTDPPFNDMTKNL